MGISIITLLVGCREANVPHCSYEASPVDIGIVQKGESLIGKGPSAFSVDGHFMWGASVLKSEEDGKYYMVYSAPEAGEHPFNNAWVYGSKMGLAVSDRPNGGFRQLGFFLNADGFTPDTSSWDAQTVMNPHLRHFGNKYYLYYVGGKDAGNLPVKSKADTLDQRSRIQQMLCIGVLEFDSFDKLLKGEFVKSKTPLLSPRTRVKPNDIVAPSPEGTQPKPDNIIVVSSVRQEIPPLLQRKYVRPALARSARGCARRLAGRAFRSTGYRRVRPAFNRRTKTFSRRSLRLVQPERPSFLCRIQRLHRTFHAIRPLPGYHVFGRRHRLEATRKLPVHEEGTDSDLGRYSEGPPPRTSATAPG